MPIAITEEQLALQESIKAWSGSFDTTSVRDREPQAGSPGAPTRQWSGLAELGALGVALPEHVGGGGGTVADLAAALEQAAAALVPGPLLSTALAGVLLSSRSDQAVAHEILTGIVDGSFSVAVAGDVDGSADVSEGGGRDTGSDVVLSGEIDHVVSAGDTSHLLVPASGGSGESWFVLATDQPGVAVTAREPMDFSRTYGRVSLSAAEAVRVEGLGTSEVRDLAVTLASAEASGVAAWCLRTAVDHARTREQFGHVIGTFQAVKHLCAQMACRVEQVAAVSWDAARTVHDAPDERPLASAVAGALALDAAVEVAKDCVQVLGGIGFTWEHDAHLYLRRAMALRRTGGGGSRWRKRAAELASAGMRRSVRVPEELLEQAEPQRPEIRRLLRAVSEAPESEQRGRLAESGCVAPHWPAPYGRDASPALSLIIDEELERAGVRRPDLTIGGWAVPTLIAHGTDQQRERFVRPTLRGEVVWCQLFSEPEAGSDLASLRTKAVRVDGGWKLTGQKVWTSLARDAHWAICLARTDADAAKHQGITYFLVDMASPGVEIRPLREITGDAVFNEVFLHEVFVPDTDVVGAPGQGWKIARATLANERVALSGSSLGKGVERALELCRDGTAQVDAEVLDKLGGHVATSVSTALLGLRSTLRRLHGDESAGALSSVEKLVGVWHRQDVAEFALEMFGPDAAAVDGAASAAVHEFLVTRCLSIAGGTTQVLLSVVGERLLGLPRG
ncbi:acyl-CoA dehydrogenase [Allosaccharopolyspora coralli]|uniref:Acyl-CoA dehydrogenase n=1 Tax=Allosaccharopolyspora coralli TaxID=2665642 RepID=A0A5Q3QAJ8_9PSEU|nr:acyl-CoA dehydrogenase [Allosaccharopolyspora coralli]QGK70386.1 acyl-CoA dehydrogenase [Allosaccharopolyspora coralli]